MTMRLHPSHEHNDYIVLSLLFWSASLSWHNIFNPCCQCFKLNPVLLQLVHILFFLLWIVCLFVVPEDNVDSLWWGKTALGNNKSIQARSLRRKEAGPCLSNKWLLEFAWPCVRSVDIPSADFWWTRQMHLQKNGCTNRDWILAAWQEFEFSCVWTLHSQTMRVCVWAVKRSFSSANTRGGKYCRQTPKNMKKHSWWKTPSCNRGLKARLLWVMEMNRWRMRIREQNKQARTEASRSHNLRKSNKGSDKLRDTGKILICSRRVKTHTRTQRCLFLYILKWGIFRTPWRGLVYQAYSVNETKYYLQ